MQRTLGFMLVMSLVYACTAGATLHSQQLPGSFKIAITRRAKDSTANFDPTGAKLEAQAPAVAPIVAARADDPSSPVVPAASNDSRTARLSLQAQSENITSGDVALHPGSIRFGTPPQELQLDISTSPGDIWVRANCGTACSKDLRWFNKTASTSYNDMGTNYIIHTTAVNLTARLSEDVISVQGLTIQKQAFGLLSQPPLDSSHVHPGVLGLGLKSYAQRPTFVQNLIDEKIIDKPIVSVHLARPGQTTDSEACFGCFDDKKAIGNSSWVPRASEDNWEVELTRLSFNKTTVTSPGVKALIDTFDSLIVLPQELAECFYDMIPGARPAGILYEEGYFEYPCNTSALISLTLGPDGLELPMNATDFNLGPTSADSSYCTGGIVYRVGLPNNTALIGDVFLRSWYLTFNYADGMIGFAPSINNK